MSWFRNEDLQAKVLGMAQGEIFRTEGPPGAVRAFRVLSPDPQNLMCLVIGQAHGGEFLPVEEVKGKFLAMGLGDGFPRISLALQGVKPEAFSASDDSHLRV